MGELGENSAELHRQTGALIHLAPADEAWLIGEMSNELAAGLIQSGATPAALHPNATLAEIRTRLENFAGDAFIKGSHASGYTTLEGLIGLVPILLASFPHNRE
jgi:UDP-N-acetylmuramyl pentapeptide synthase